jgi:hypothetical protein
MASPPYFGEDGVFYSHEMDNNIGHFQILLGGDGWLRYGAEALQ